MDCARAQEWIHGWVDGELEPAERVELEQHLKTCVACEDLHRSVRALQADLRGANLRESAPEPLAARIRAALDSEGRPAAARRGALRRFAPLLVSFAAGIFLTIAIQQFGALVREGSRESELVDAHVRSLMAERPIDVASSDRHTVKPWFSGKLDFSPWADDLSSDGFPMLGGRVDRLAGQSAAAIVYRSNRHLINLFIRRADAAGDGGESHLSRRGYHLVQWKAGDLDYAAISDVSEAELDRFVALVRSASR